MVDTPPTAPAPPLTNQVVFAIADAATGDLKRQGYCFSTGVDGQAAQGEIAVQAPHVLKLENWRVDIAATPPVLVSREAQTLLPAFTYNVNDDLGADLTLDVGAVVSFPRTGTSFAADAAGKVRITFPGSGPQFMSVAVPGKLTWSNRVAVSPLGQQKAALKVLVDSDRNNKLMNTVTLDTGQVLDADDKSLLSLMALAVQAALATAQAKTFTTQWILHDNTVVTLNAAQLLKAAKAVSDSRTTAFLAARTLKNQVDAAATVQDAKTVVDGAGIPTGVVKLFLKGA